MYRLHCEDQSGSFLNFIRYLKWPSQHGLGASEGVETSCSFTIVIAGWFSVPELVYARLVFITLFLFLLIGGLKKTTFFRVSTSGNRYARIHKLQI